MGEGGKAKGRPPERTTSPVSIPTEELRDLEAFLERYGRQLGYRGRADYIRTAIRTQRERDEARLLRLSQIGAGAGSLDWHDADH